MFAHKDAFAKKVPCRTGIERTSSKIYVKSDVSFITQGLLVTRSMLAGIWKPDFLFATIWIRLKEVGISWDYYP